jgi:hypothetical protein
MNFFKSPIVTIILIVLLVVTTASTVLLAAKSGRLRDELAATPNVDLSLITPPAGAIVCGVCTGCEEVHFTWPPMGYHDHDYTCGDCDHFDELPPLDE